ncbi:unnamed protein product [Rhizopus stolonifer]
MKYFLSLVCLVASTFAACNCPPTNQACMDKCEAIVITANTCVVQCQKSRMGTPCEQSCFVNNWPSIGANTTAMVSAQPIPSVTNVASKTIIESSLPTTTPINSSSSRTTMMTSDTTLSVKGWTIIGVLCFSYFSLSLNIFI